MRGRVAHSIIKFKGYRDGRGHSIIKLKVRRGEAFNNENERGRGGVVNT